MSYEAVPCMFRSSAQNGNGETQYLGLLIRPSANQQNPPNGTPSGSIVGRTNNGQPVSTLTPTSNSVKGPQPLLVQGVYPQGGPIVVQGETPKVLVPAKVQVRLQQSGDASVAISPTAIPSSTLPMATSTMGWSQAAPMKAAFASSGHNIMSSPCNTQHRSLSVCSASPQLDSSPMSPLPNIIQYHNHTTPSSTRVGMQADPRSTRVTGTGQWAAPVSDSSTTPDSGIQSVPGSPPSSHPLTPPTMQLEGCDSVCEERCDNDEDFADMPRLLPVDQEDAQCSNSCLSVREDVASSHGSECETAPTPSISITPTMDSKDIVEQLLMLDPEKANAIANLIKRRQNSKRRSSSKQEMAQKRGRPASSASEDQKKSEEEPTPTTTRVATRSTSRASQKDNSRAPGALTTKVDVSPSCVDDSKEIGSQEISPVPSEQICSESPSSEERKSTSGSQSYDLEMRKLYREAIKRMMKEKLASLLEATVVDMQGLHIGLRERHDRRHSKERKNLFTVNWEQVRKRRRKEDDRKRVAERSERKKEVVSKSKDRDHPKREPREKSNDANVSRVETNVERRSRKRRNESMEKEKEKDEPRTRSAHSSIAKRLGCCEAPCPSKREKEYEEIPRSMGVGNLPEWDSPVLSCGCTRGACTSDSECVNRALCVQCPLACAAPLCANKKFWKDDAMKSLVVSGAKTRKILRTKQARRAGDFLCEFAGEVIRYEDAKQRWETYSKTEATPVILCLTSRLFVDATIRGNVSRYVRQSCRPNARLEVWSVNGKYRAGLFSLGEIASGAEITIDMNGLLPPIAAASDLSINEERIIRKNHLFLMRNRQSSITRAGAHGLVGSFGPPASLVEGLRTVLRGIVYRVRRVDGRLPLKALPGYHRVSRLLHSVERQRAHLSKSELSAAFDMEMGRWLDQLADEDFERAYAALRGRYLCDAGKSEKDEKPKRDRRREARFVNRDTNLEYIDSIFRVGSYDPDEVWPLGKANEKDDAVRCVCGSLEEDGEMTQCDTCNFWLHSECLDTRDVDQETEYKCQFCHGAISGGRPCSDVILAKQPDIRLYGCCALLHRHNQQRVNSSPNSMKPFDVSGAGIRDDHKKILKKLMDVNEKRKKDEVAGEEKFDDIPSAAQDRLPPETFHRKDLRVFRVERLFSAPGGHRFVFGFYYARPHETFCDSQRIFHRNEVFATPLYDTLPLDAVVGRCTVLDPSVWCLGRPTVPKFKEEDVYLCEYQIDRNQRSFEKIPSKNRYPINTQPYVFRKFDEPITIKRDFTPFIVDSSSPSSSSQSKSSSKDKDASEGVNSKRIMMDNLSAIVEKLKSPSKTVELKVQAEEEKKRRRPRKLCRTTKPSSG
ncbi:SET domain protein [Ostertagia ostertagi]